MDWSQIFDAGLIAQWNVFTEEWFCHTIGKSYSGSFCSARMSGGQDGFAWGIMAFALALWFFPHISGMLREIFGLIVGRDSKRVVGLGGGGDDLTSGTSSRVGEGVRTERRFWSEEDGTH